ncbi:unnamed protein product [Protopolystoma xenopodis]|uniref:Uncharacterized protein n=1 Tax=Protopolystoma xenopodis TaxID=117903 RepID=A0A3S5A012_9PLAT|nr:unnamed protein product [Protopolystoma xenopodis]
MLLPISTLPFGGSLAFAVASGRRYAREPWICYNLIFISLIGSIDGGGEIIARFALFSLDFILAGSWIALHPSLLSPCSLFFAMMPHL